MGDSSDAGHLSDLISFLKPKYGIEYITYARYFDKSVHWVTSHQARLELFLGGQASVLPKEVTEKTPIIDMRGYCSDDFLSSCKMHFNHNSQGVTMFLRHNDHFSEHISIGSSIEGVNVKVLLYENPAAKVEILFNVRSGVNFYFQDNNAMVSDYNRVVQKHAVEDAHLRSVRSRPNRIYVYGYSGDSFITRCEMDCLLRVLQLQTSKQIARNLGVSSKTVERHISNLKSKFGVFDRHGLFLVAMNNQLI